MPKSSRILKLSSTTVRIYLLAKTRPDLEEGFANLCDSRGKVTSIQVAFDHLEDLPEKLRLLLKKGGVTWPPRQRARLVGKAKTAKAAIRSACLCLLLATGQVSCKQEPSSPSVVPTTQTAAQARPQPAPDVSAFVGQMPPGWREFRLGMSEKEARQLVRKYKKDAAWEPTMYSTFPVFDPGTLSITTEDLDKSRFHVYYLPNLDEGTSGINLWFDDGKLFAVLVEGTVATDVFLKKAASSYGADPRRFRVVFKNDIVGHQDSTGEHVVSFWRGTDVTALIWEIQGPTLLLFSDRNRDAVQSALASARQPKNNKTVEKAAEGATRF